MTNFLLLAVVGLAAQLVDGSLGMAYGVTSQSLLLAVGIAPGPARPAGARARGAAGGGISGDGLWGDVAELVAGGWHRAGAGFGGGSHSRGRDDGRVWGLALAGGRGRG